MLFSFNWTELSRGFGDFWSNLLALLVIVALVAIFVAMAGAGVLLNIFPASAAEALDGEGDRPHLLDLFWTKLCAIPWADAGKVASTITRIVVITASLVIVAQGCHLNSYQDGLVLGFWTLAVGYLTSSLLIPLVTTAWAIGMLVPCTKQSRSIV